MNYGYIRISDTGPAVESQTRLLLSRGCDRIFTDLTRGNKSSRDAFEDLFKVAASGDTLIVTNLSRFECTLKELIELLSTLLERGVNVISLEENFDSLKQGQDKLLKFCQSLLSFEQSRMQEKKKLGLGSARARGKLGGRPKKLDPSKAAIAKSLYRDKKHSISDICDILKVSRATLYRYLS